MEVDRGPTVFQDGVHQNHHVLVHGLVPTQRHLNRRDGVATLLEIKGGRQVTKGLKVIAYGLLTTTEAVEFRPRIVHVDAVNSIIEIASDAASYSTGSTFFIDGGMLRQAGSL